ncbi:MAG: response regulator [Euryarchaeota archaeon]|nr:response regulator [Euryarchaeota archaeon]
MTDREGLRSEYFETLKSYLKRKRESDLEEAYIIGRAAEVQGIGVLDIANWHQQALVDILKNENASDSSDIVKMASLVVNECLAPYEMAYRGFWEANQKLQKVNELLKQHTDELERANEELRAVEAALESESERLAVTLQSIGDGVITTNNSGRITLINKVAEGLTGWDKDDARDRPIEEVFNIVDEKTREKRVNPASRAISSHMTISPVNHTILISKDGIERHIGDSGAPIQNSRGETMGAVLVFRDLTREIKMEEEIAKVGRLDSIGVLAGGLAHDFNNILTVIEGNISLAKVNRKDDQGYDRFLQKAEMAAERARELTKLLLIFSKGGEPIKKVMFIEDLIRDTTKLGLAGSSVRPVFSIPPDLRPVEGDEGQLNQALMNIIVNAKEAMVDGGLLEVTAGNTDEADGNETTVGTKYVWISLKDNGPGMLQDDLSKVFDPYFSKRAKGRGLGLSIVSSIVKRHGGKVKATSVIGTGTTFTIYLPASEKMPVLVVTPVELVQGSGKVLWMDDEDAIRDLATIMLSSLGYEPSVAQDGKEAIMMYEEAIADGHPYSAVILDLTIPGGMGGRETIKRLIEIDKKIKAIVCSGYSNDETISKFREHGFAGSLPKPFKMHDLERILNEVTNLRVDRQVLDQDRTSTADRD